MDNNIPKHSELTFRLMVESAPNALILVNHEGKIAFTNDRAEKLFSYTSNELIGQLVEILISKKLREGHQLNRDSFFQSPVARSMGVGRDLFARKKDGTEFPVEIGLNPIVTMEGTMILASIIDITERKKAEEQQALLASIINSSDDAIISKTPDGIITSWNSGAEKLFGYTEKEVIGKNVSILIPADRVNEEPKIINSVKKGEYVKHYETERIRKNGSRIFISLTVSPIKNKSGKIIGASKIARDITEKKEAEKKLLKANRLYSFLSHINQTIVHNHDQKALFDESCRIAVSFGKFELAWIGLVDETNKCINVVAQANAATGHPELLSNLAYDEDGPTIKVVRSGKYYISNNAEQEPEGSHSREYLKRHNFGSFIALPINKSGKTIGTFNIFSPGTYAFDDEEITLLLEAAGDISFALNGFEKEKRLKQSEARLVAAQEIAHLGDWEYDLSNQKVSWSDEYYRIHDLEPGSVTPSVNLALSLVHPDDQQRVADEIGHSQISFMPFSHFRRIVNKNGNIKHIYATGIYEQDETGKPIRFHGTALDVTEITKKEEELSRSELKFRDFFENAPEAIVIVDLDKGATFQQCNNNALKLLKYSQEELNAKTPEDISPPFQPDGRKSSEKAIELTIATMSGERPVVEWATRNADGEDFICELRLVKLSGANDNIIMASFIDITERKNAEKIKGKITLDLMQRNKDLEQFMYIVSHNLRAPVANILGITDLLQNIKLNLKEEKEMVADLSTSTNRLDNVIKDLNYILSLKQDVTEKREVVKFSTIVEDISLSIANLIKTCNVELIYNFSEIDEILTVKSYLYSVFYNLISNSIKYRQPDVNPILEITSAKAGNNIILTFKDNGLGIDLKRKGGQVFGLYKRFHTHTEGKGMGLYMAKTQVEIMGGSISVISEVNEGTEFKIEFYSN